MTPMNKPKAEVNGTSCNENRNECNASRNERNDYVTPITPTKGEARRQELRLAVVKALDAFDELGRKPSYKAIRDMIGSGSMETLQPIIREVLEERARLKLKEIGDQKYHSEFVDAAVTRAADLLYSLQNREADRKVKEMQLVIDGLIVSTKSMVDEACEELRLKDEQIVKISTTLTEKEAEIVKLQKKYNACRRELEESRRRLSEIGEKNTEQMGQVLELLNELTSGGKKKFEV